MENWENIAKRMIVVNQLGMRIEEDSGHRYIIFDDEADFSIQNELEKNNIIPKYSDKEDFHVIVKHYGSYISALNLIDCWLREIGEPILLDKFNKWFPNDYDLDRLFDATNDV